MKKLLFVTGTRADFGKLEPLAVAARDQGFDVRHTRVILRSDNEPALVL